MTGQTRAATWIGASRGGQAIHRSALATPQLVVAGVDGDSQQPAAQPAGRALERLQAPKSTQQGVLRGIRGILAVAQRAVADVEDLALILQHQPVEGGDVAALSRLQRLCDTDLVKRTHGGLHSQMLLSGGLRYGEPRMSMLRWLPSVLLLVPWLLGAVGPGDHRGSPRL